MKPEFENIALHDNKAANRFEMKFEHRDSLVEYEIDGDIISLLHTEVDPALEGRGAGTAMVEKVLNEIKDRNMQLIPLCPFVVAYIKRHPEWENLIVTR
ncbi:MAG: N-acetyltransferase [Rhizobacter sp.]|nr:N-acetyltransferase [Ferruginibacter sp.]